jgi:hypothetical protein
MENKDDDNDDDLLLGHMQEKKYNTDLYESNGY